MVWIHYEELELEFEQLMAQSVEAMEPSLYILDKKPKIMVSVTSDLANFFSILYYE